MSKNKEPTCLNCNHHKVCSYVDPNELTICKLFTSDKLTEKLLEEINVWRDLQYESLKKLEAIKQVIKDIADGEICPYDGIPIEKIEEILGVEE